MVISHYLTPFDLLGFTSQLNFPLSMLLEEVTTKYCTNRYFADRGSPSTREKKNQRYVVAIAQDIVEFSNRCV